MNQNYDEITLQPERTERDDMAWHAYCITCREPVADTRDGIDNGAMAEAYGKRHARINPGHRVIVGYVFSVTE